MRFWDKVMVKWNGLREKTAPFFEKLMKFFKKVDKILTVIWKYLSAFKKIWISIPIGIAAVMLAINNLTKLPAVVGLNLRVDGTFALQTTRGIAVICPLFVTLICVLLVFCSRRTLTPWFASLVSLLIPVAILLINTFPG
jgi:hypothetical protein